MSGIIGSRFNIRGSGLVGSLGTDGQVFTSSGAGAGAVFEAAGGGAWNHLVTTTASDDDYIDEYIELVGDLDVFPNLATCAMWADNKKFAVEIIQEAEKRTDEAVNRTTQTMYDINDIADFVERDDSYGINDKEWGKILRNKANEIGCDHRKG